MRAHYVMHGHTKKHQILQGGRWGGDVVKSLDCGFQKKNSKAGQTSFEFPGLIISIGAGPSFLVPALSD